MKKLIKNMSILITAAVGFFFCYNDGNFSIQRRSHMKRRNIVLAVIFSVITLGIYAIYWYICLTNDSNRMNPQEKTASGELAFLFSVLTLGIYNIYWSYKLAKKVGDSEILYLILSLFGFGIVNYILAQSKINAA